MTALADRRLVPLRTVREWALARGYSVGKRGHLPNELVAKFNRLHRETRAENRNPMAIEASVE